MTQRWKRTKTTWKKSCIFSSYSLGCSKGNLARKLNKAWTRNIFTIMSINTIISLLHQICATDTFKLLFYVFWFLFVTHKEQQWPHLVSFLKFNIQHIFVLATFICIHISELLKSIYLGTKILTVKLIRLHFFDLHWPLFTGQTRQNLCKNESKPATVNGTQRSNFFQLF